MSFIAQSLGCRARDTKDKGIIQHWSREGIYNKFLASKIALEERCPFARISIHRVVSRKLSQILERECKDMSSSFFGELAILLF